MLVTGWTVHHDLSCIVIYYVNNANAKALGSAAVTGFVNFSALFATPLPVEIEECG